MATDGSAFPGVQSSRSSFLTATNMTLNKTRRHWTSNVGVRNEHRQKQASDKIGNIPGECARLLSSAASSVQDEPYPGDMHRSLVKEEPEEFTVHNSGEGMNEYFNSSIPSQFTDQTNAESSGYKMALAHRPDNKLDLMSSPASTQSAYHASDWPVSPSVDSWPLHIIPAEGHINQFTGGQPSICDGKFVSTSSALHSHDQKSDAAIKPHACGICGRTFLRNDYLQKHIRTHTGERPFSCSYCGKSFVQSYNLSRHIVIHTGDKPYSCDVCGRRFSTRDKCRLHAQKDHAV
jgi:uncharacterized Zn-finger protein